MVLMLCMKCMVWKKPEVYAITTEVMADESCMSFTILCFSQAFVMTFGVLLNINLSIFKVKNV